MSTSPQTFVHYVSLNKFAGSIDKVMTTSFKLFKPRSKTVHMPTLIGVDLEYNGYAESVPVYRQFMKNLRKVHQRHFVRFVSDTLWTMESDNGDIFYTCDGAKQDWCDVHWLIKIGQNNQVEVHVSVGLPNPQRELLGDILTSFHRLVSGYKNDNGVALETFKKVILNFYKTTKRFSQAKHLVENLHVLLIPTPTGRAYFPHLIYGMTYGDAKRRARSLHTGMEINYRQHSNIFRNDYCSGESYGQLLESLIENNVVGSRQALAQENYNLAENLFSVFSTTEDIQFKHDITLFYLEDLEKLYVNTVRCDMLDFAHVK